MNGHGIAMLGTGLIADFYAATLHSQRGRDRVAVAYSRSAERGAAFAERWSVPNHTTSLAEAVGHPTSTWSSSACRTTCTSTRSGPPPRRASPCCAPNRSAAPLTRPGRS